MLDFFYLYAVQFSREPKPFPLNTFNRPLKVVETLHSGLCILQSIVFLVAAIFTVLIEAVILPGLWKEMLEFELSCSFNCLFNLRLY